MALSQASNLLLLAENVIPAKAGIQVCKHFDDIERTWIPASAGMTYIVQSDLTA